MVTVISPATRSSRAGRASVGESVQKSRLPTSKSSSSARAAWPATNPEPANSSPGSDEPERSAPPRADDHAGAAHGGGGAEPALRVQPIAGDLVADRPRCGDQQSERQRHAPEVGRLPRLAPRRGRRRRRCNDVRRCCPLADLPGGCSRLPQRNGRAGEEEHDRPRTVHVARPGLTEQHDDTHRRSRSRRVPTARRPATGVARVGTARPRCRARHRDR